MYIFFSMPSFQRKGSGWCFAVLFGQMIILIKRFLYCIGYALTGAGILLRFLLMPLFLEYDELFTAITANPFTPFSYIVKNYLIIDVHPPLYNAFLWVFNHFGPWTREIWLHLPSLFFSLASLVAAWVLFPRRFGKTARFIFVALLACSAEIIRFASIARSYSMFLFFSVLFTFAALQVLEKFRLKEPISSKTRWWFWISGLLLSYTHYFGFAGFCAATGLLAGMGWYLKSTERCLFIGAGVVVLLMGLWLVPNLYYNLSMGRFSGNWWAYAMPLYGFLTGFYSFFFSNNLLGAKVACFNLFVIGYYYFHARTEMYKDRLFDLLFLVCWFYAVLAGALLISLRTYMLMPRFFMIVLPALYLAYALLLAPLVKRFNWVLLLVLVYTIMSLHIFSLYFLPRIGDSARYAKYFARYYASTYAPGTEVFVLSAEGYPDNTIGPMVSFYLNDYYGYNTPITVLNTLGAADLDAAIARSKRAVVLMPFCSREKIGYVSKRMRRPVYIKYPIVDSCIMTFDKQEEGMPSY